MTLRCGSLVKEHTFVTLDSSPVGSSEVVKTSDIHCCGRADTHSKVRCTQRKCHVVLLNKNDAGRLSADVNEADLSDAVDADVSR